MSMMMSHTGRCHYALSYMHDWGSVCMLKCSVGCCRLLCAVVDNVEALLDEWFPGLRDFDTLSGDELVQPMALCPLCPSE